VDLRDFPDVLTRAREKRHVLAAFAHCAITYSGRAEAFLGRGDRLIVLKADGTFLIHQPEGGMPINYMKAGGAIAIEEVDDHYLIRITNAAEKSALEIEVFRVHECITHELSDGQKQDLGGHERDMSDWIRDNPESIDKEFRPIAREEQTDVGFIDVFGHDGDGRLVVVECKRVTASLTAVDQLRRYVERVKQIKGTARVHGILAAPGITPNALEMLLGFGYEYRKVEPPKRLVRWQQDQKRLAEY
jgi:RecB family endonuclease NucS